MLETEIFGYKIVHQKVGNVVEIVVNANVYAEKTIAENATYSIVANVDFHQIIAGFDGKEHYLAFDGDVILRETKI